MKRLHHAFKLLLAKDKRTKSEIARMAQLDLSVVSRLSKGDNDISAAALGRLARAFPSESDRLTLLAAWVQDKVEEAGFGLAQLRAAFGVEGDLTIPPRIREDLRLLLRDVKNDREPIIELIHALAVWAEPAGQAGEAMVVDTRPATKALSHPKVARVRK